MQKESEPRLTSRENDSKGSKRFEFSARGSQSKATNSEQTESRDNAKTEEQRTDSRNIENTFGNTVSRIDNTNKTVQKHAIVESATNVTSRPTMNMRDIDSKPESDVLKIVQRLIMTMDDGAKKTIEDMLIEGKPKVNQLVKLSEATVSVDNIQMKTQVRDKNVLSTEIITSEALKVIKDRVDIAQDPTVITSHLLERNEMRVTTSLSNYQLKNEISFNDLTDMFRINIAKPDFEGIFKPRPIGKVEQTLPVGALGEVFEKTWETIGPGSVTAVWALSPSFQSYLEKYGVSWDGTNFTLSDEYNSKLHVSAATSSSMSTATQSAILARMLVVVAMSRYASVLLTDSSVTISTIARNLNTFGEEAQSLVGKELLLPIGFVPSLMKNLSHNQFVTNRLNLALQSLSHVKLGRVASSAAPGTNVIQERVFNTTIDTLTSTIIALERARLRGDSNAGEDILQMLTKCATNFDRVSFNNQMSRMINVHANLPWDQLTIELLHALILFPNLKRDVIATMKEIWTSMGVMQPSLSQNEVMIALTDAQPNSLQERFGQGVRNLLMADPIMFIDAKIYEYGPDFFNFTFDPIGITRNFHYDFGVLTTLVIFQMRFPRLFTFGKHHVGNYLYDFVMFYDMQGSFKMSSEWKGAAVRNGTDKKEGNFKARDTMEGQQSVFFTEKFRSANLIRLQEFFTPIVLRVPQNEKDSSFPRIFDTPHVFGGSNDRIMAAATTYSARIAKLFTWGNNLDHNVRVSADRRASSAVVASNTYHSNLRAALEPEWKKEIYWGRLMTTICHYWFFMGNGYNGELSSLPPFTIGLKSTTGQFDAVRSLMSIETQPVHISWGLGFAGAEVIVPQLGGLNTNDVHREIPNAQFLLPAPEAILHSYLLFISAWYKERLPLGYMQFIHRLMTGNEDVSDDVRDVIHDAMKSWVYASKSTGLKKILKLVSSALGSGDNNLGLVAYGERMFETPDVILEGALTIVGRESGGEVIRAGNAQTTPRIIGSNLGLTYLDNEEKLKLNFALSHVMDSRAPLSHLVKGIFFRKVTMTPTSERVSVTPGKGRRADGTTLIPIIRPNDDNFQVILVSDALRNCFCYGGESFVTSETYPVLDFVMKSSDLTKKNWMEVLIRGVEQGKFGLYIEDARLFVQVTHTTERTSSDEIKVFISLIQSISPNAIPTYHAPRTVVDHGKIFALAPTASEIDYYVHLLNGNDFSEAIMDSPFSESAGGVCYIPSPLFQHAGDLHDDGLTYIGEIPKVSMVGDMSYVNPVPVLNEDSLVTLSSLDFTVSRAIDTTPLDDDRFLSDIY